MSWPPDFAPTRASLKTKGNGHFVKIRAGHGSFAKDVRMTNFLVGYISISVVATGTESSLVCIDD